MSGMSLASRFLDYLERQIAWLDAMLAELASLDSEVDSADLDSLIARQQAFSKRAQTLAHEFKALQREWAGAHSLPADERVAVRALARRAQERVGQVREANGRLLVRIEARAADVKKELGEVRKGQEMLRKYRPRGGSSGSFVDRKA